MSQGNRILWALLIAAGASGLSIGAPARAQVYVCPAGPQGNERSAGMTPEGNGIAAMPLCWDDGPTDNGPAPQAYDQTQHMEAMSNAANQLALDMQRYAEGMQKLQSDPGYQRYMNGEWRFFQARSNSKPGENCTALWMRQRGLFSIAGPGPGYPGGLITFWSDDIPKVKKPKMVTASIKQSDGSTQTVKAVNYMVPSVDFGAITLAVPNINAGINDLADQDHIELLLGGKAVAQIDWTEGLTARKKLQQCVAGRATK